MKKTNIKVLYRFIQTHIGEEQDEEGRYFTTTRTETSVIQKEFDHKEIKKAFLEESGDGDDSGSWSITLLMILDYNNKILLEPARIGMQFLNDKSVDMKDVERCTDKIVDMKKEHIECGNFLLGDD